jgi:hypothetical protein
MDCPRCGLANPPSAISCDCGFNFSTRRTEPSSLRTPLPKGIHGLMIFCLAVWTLSGVLRLTGIAGPVTPAVAAYCLVAIGVLWFMYVKFVAGHNWARIAFGILTLPIGLVILFSDAARLYCRQKRGVVKEP